MSTIKKVMVSLLLVLLALPVYANVGVVYSQPGYGYGSSCLVWVPQSQLYVNTCTSYYQNYPGVYYYGHNNEHEHHEHGGHGGGGGGHHHH